MTELEEAIGHADRLKVLLQKHTCEPFEVGTAIYEYEQFKARVLHRRAVESMAREGEA